MPAAVVDLESPGTSYVTVDAALGHPVFDSPTECERFLGQLDGICTVFSARVYAYVMTAASVQLILRQDGGGADTDDTLRERWSRLRTRTVPSSTRLRDRLSSLGGLMQTLLQRYSRDRNRRHGTRGRLWASRYRSSLIADDRSLLAAIAWMEDAAPALSAISSSRDARSSSRAPLTLAAPPLRIGPGEFLFPADESPPGCPPPLAPDHAACLQRFSAGISENARVAYGHALRSGWALGRPESLGGVLQRLARVNGRGRSRRLRELDDDLGLCGVWG